MRRADRLFRIIEILRQRRVRTAADLADRLGVSVRTVYRDVADLAGSGVPIEGEAGVGYRLGRGFDLPPLMFDQEEVRSLVLGARMVAAWGDPGLRQAARTVLSKVEAMLPEEKRTLLHDTALFSPEFRAPRGVVRRLAVVREAVEGRRKVTFNYADRHEQKTHRTVRPLGLFFWGGTWAVGAWCELRVAHRSFLLDRMSEITLTDETFSPSEEVSLEGFMASVR